MANTDSNPPRKFSPAINKLFMNKLRGYIEE